MNLPEGTPDQTGTEEIRQAIFELLSEIIDQDPPKVPSEYFSQEFCSFIDLCLQVRSNVDRLIQAFDCFVDAVFSVGLNFYTS